MCNMNQDISKTWITYEQGTYQIANIYIETVPSAKAKAYWIAIIRIKQEPDTEQVLL